VNYTRAFCILPRTVDWYNFLKKKHSNLFVSNRWIFLCLCALSIPNQAVFENPKFVLPWLDPSALHNFCL